MKENTEQEIIEAYISLYKNNNIISSEKLKLMLDASIDILNAMKKIKIFNYSYYGTAITKSTFEENVPENWQDDLDEYGDYSHGGYRAVERD